jgi:glycosyltransferase involved in cell wall biosynthesis
MRVLYVIGFQGALSESYVRTEIEWMQRQGIDVCTVSHEPQPLAAYPDTIPADKRLVGRSITAAVARFQPDLIHAHWLVTLLQQKHRPFLDGLKVPITVRGHGFDSIRSNIAAIAGIPAVRRIWLFPHFMYDVQHPKLQALPVAYNNAIMTPGTAPPTSPRVLRVMAGLPQKRIENMLEIARLCPEIPFTLIMTQAPEPDYGYAATVRAAAPPNVEVLFDLPREEVLGHFQRSTIYLMTPPDHRFGMPISIAEAMGVGLWPLVPLLPGARAYIGHAGMTFDSLGEAAALIKVAAGWEPHIKERYRVAAVEQAQQYSADVVLPTILDEWRQLTQR